MSTRAAGGIIAAIIIAVGIVVGFWSHSVPLGFTDPHGDTTLSCGSAFSPDTSKASLAGAESGLRGAIIGDDSTSDDEFIAQCGDAVQLPRIIAIVLIGVGVLAGLFLLLTAPRPSGQAVAEPEPEST